MSEYWTFEPVEILNWWSFGASKIMIMVLPRAK
jgi:hypothetical protein